MAFRALANLQAEGSLQRLAVSAGSAAGAAAAVVANEVVSEAAVTAETINVEVEICETAAAEAAAGAAARSAPAVLAGARGFVAVAFAADELGWLATAVGAAVARAGMLGTVSARSLADFALLEAALLAAGPLVSPVRRFSSAMFLANSVIRAAF